MMQGLLTGLTGAGAGAGAGSAEEGGLPVFALTILTARQITKKRCVDIKGKK